MDLGKIAVRHRGDLAEGGGKGGVGLGDDLGVGEELALGVAHLEQGLGLRHRAAQAPLVLDPLLDAAAPAG